MLLTIHLSVGVLAMPSGRSPPTRRARIRSTKGAPRLRADNDDEPRRLNPAGVVGLGGQVLDPTGPEVPVTFTPEAGGSTRAQDSAEHTARVSMARSDGNASACDFGVTWALIETTTERLPSAVEAANWVYPAVLPVWP